MRQFKNHLGLSALDTKCILIADGPSKRIPIEHPKLITLDYPVAVVNRVGYQYPGRKDYWFSLHPENFCEWADRATNLSRCAFIGFKVSKLNLSTYRYINTNYRLITGGTSSLFAIENLIAIGYKEIDLYGVDMDIEPYLGHRKCWSALADTDCVIKNKGGIWHWEN